MSEQWGMNGIVDRVRAVRRNDEVQYLEASIHIKMGEEDSGQYGGEVTIDLPVPLPTTTQVNPGDVVSVQMQFVNPFGQRFMPALEVSQENPADVIDEDLLEDTDNTPIEEDIDA